MTAIKELISKFKEKITMFTAFAHEGLFVGRVRKSGNSMVVTIPPEVQMRQNIGEGDKALFIAGVPLDEDSIPEIEDILKEVNVKFSKVEVNLPLDDSGGFVVEENDTKIFDGTDFFDGGRNEQC